MEKLFNGTSIIGGLVGGFFSYHLGDWDLLLRTLTILVILDFVTGILKGIINKNLTSKISFVGIAKKVFIFTIVAVGHLLQQLIGNALPFREIVIMFYICNEGLSLLENAAEFIPIPEKIKEALLQLRDKK